MWKSSILKMKKITSKQKHEFKEKNDRGSSFENKTKKLAFKYTVRKAVVRLK